MAKVTLQGNPVEISGDLPAIGSKAPGFKLVNAELQTVGLADFAGKKKILNIVPSLDTGTCATSARKFNERAGAREDCVTLVVSADLPFAQKRFCSTEGLEAIVPLSMMRSKNFAKDYGVLIQNGPLEGVTARAIVVLDAEDNVVHTELVGEIVDEPDYDAALAAVG